MFEKWIVASIEYRYLVLVISLSLCGFGFFIVKELNIDAVPDITNNQVQINTSAPGLSPEEVEKKITLPLEMALQGIKGLEGTRSLSRDSFSQVTAIFDESTDVYFARQQITERLSSLKDEIPFEPQMGSVTTGLGEIFMWVVDYNEPRKLSTPGFQKDGTYLTPEGKKLSSELEMLSYLREVQDWIIKPQLKGIKGLADVDAIGGFVKEYQVSPNLNKLQHYGITFDEITDKIESNHLTTGASFIDKGGESFLVKADGRFTKIDDLYTIPIKQNILLKEIATIGIGKELRSGGATYNGKEVVTGTAMMLVGENTKNVASSVSKKLDQIALTLPPGIGITKVLDRTKLIDSTINTVRDNLFEGALLVLIVLFIFLKNVRAALICACVIPLSMLLTVMAMVQTKMTGNLMSLGAIDFGLIVDGAVIITENALRRLKPGLKLSERLAEIKAATLEMIRPSIYGQLIIITVYVPLLTLSGIEGKMFKPMAYTVILALVMALFLSMTFIPAVLALWLSSEKHQNEGLFHRFKIRYEEALKRWVKKPNKILVLGAFSILAGGLIFKSLGQEFVTALDEGDIAIQVTRIPSTALDQALSMQKRIEKALLDVDEVKLVFSKTGTAEMATDPMPKDASDTFVMLKSRTDWSDPKLSNDDLIQKMESALEGVIGNQFEYTQPINMRFNELIGGVKSDVAVHLFGDDFEMLTKIGTQIGKELEKIKGATDIIVEPVDGMLTLELVPERNKLSAFNLSVNDLFHSFVTAVQGKKAGEMYEGDRKFDITVRLQEADRNNQDILENLPVSGEILLKDVGHFELKEGLNQISRMDGKRMMTVQANVRQRDLGSFVEEMNSMIQKKRLLPAGYWYTVGGTFEHLVSAKERLSIVVPICLLCILTFLFLSLGNLKDSLVVFLSIPFALVGGVFFLFCRQMPFSISSAVGLIALSGIAVLNGLVLLTSIRKLLSSGKTLLESVVEGSSLRLRPVLMTASVASFGFLPMALSTTAGSEVQKPIATVVIGGLISSTLLTLIILPIIFKMAVELDLRSFLASFWKSFFSKRVALK